MSALDQIGVAVVGSSGHAARVAAPTVSDSTETQLMGVLGSTVANARQLAGRYPDCRPYSGWEELENDDHVNAVWIATPNHLHADTAARCLRAGKHVLLEKPLATTSSDAQRLIEVAQDSERTLRVAYQHRFRPSHVWLRDALAAGVIGDPYLLRIHRFWPFPYFAGEASASEPTWRSSLRSSGGWALNDIGSHLIDLALWLLRSPLTLQSGSTANFRFHDAEAEDTAVLVLRADSGALVTIDTSNAMASFPGTIEVYGSEGWLAAAGTFDAQGTIRAHSGEQRTFQVPSPADVHQALLHDFLCGARGEGACGTTADEGAVNVAIIEEAIAGRRRA